MGDSVEILEFNDRWAADFAALNYEWIEKFFSVEKHDREILDNPTQYVIQPGGQIFMSVIGHTAVGTVAMIPSGEGIYELTKMAVSPKHQGQGVANFLMKSCIDFAREKRAEKIFLESHRKLKPALALYAKFGFKEVATDPHSEYARADIRMELILDPD